MTTRKITVLGAGITGLWQALTLARAGHDVTLREVTDEPFTGASSWFAGAMLAPWCEAEATEPVIEQLGTESLELWSAEIPDLKRNGTLVLAAPRDQAELRQFARDTTGFRKLEAEDIEGLEPDLADRYQSALFFEREAHLAPRITMQSLLQSAKNAGVKACFGEGENASLSSDASTIIDCTGLAAKPHLQNLRGVRGEMAIIRSDEIKLNRTVRLLHPRFPIYIVPWDEGCYMLGATVIEREDAGPVTLRSALDLLSLAYTLHPALGEAEILEFGAGIRPAFPDNIPKITIRDRHIYINGLYRHGFLLAPVLARIVKDYIETGHMNSELFVED